VIAFTDGVLLAHVLAMPGLPIPARPLHMVNVAGRIHPHQAGATAGNWSRVRSSKGIVGGGALPRVLMFGRAGGHVGTGEGARRVGLAENRRHRHQAQCDDEGKHLLHGRSFTGDRGSPAIPNGVSAVPTPAGKVRVPLWKPGLTSARMLGAFASEELTLLPSRTNVAFPT